MTKQKKESHYKTRFLETNLPLPLFYTASGQQTIEYRVPSQWNSLPKDLCKTSAFASFRVNVKSHLLSLD